MSIIQPRYLIGSVIGFSIFLAGTISIGKVYFRPNFTIWGLLDYLMAPFSFGTNKFKTIWALYPGLSLWARIKLLQLNWVAMTILGTLLGFFYFK